MQKKKEPIQAIDRLCFPIGALIPEIRILVLKENLEEGKFYWLSIFCRKKVKGSVHLHKASYRSYNQLRLQESTRLFPLAIHEESTNRQRPRDRFPPGLAQCGMNVQASKKLKDEGGVQVFNVLDVLAKALYYYHQKKFLSETLCECLPCRISFSVSESLSIFSIPFFALLWEGGLG